MVCTKLFAYGQPLSYLTIYTLDPEATRNAMTLEKGASIVKSKSSSQTKLNHFECVCDQLLQSFLTLFDPLDCSPPGSSVRGILQTRILERVAMPSSREFS